MCFKNLPIEFDDAGKARLRAGVVDPYSVTVAQPKGYVRRKGGPGAQLAAPPRLRDWNIDPMTRVAGALAVHTVLDLENRRAVDAHARAMLFRGYEVILEGRDPRDAIDISSRACGVCGGTHASCSALNIEQAFGVCPPPLGVEVRNLGEVGEMFYDRPLHLGLLAGPDYSTALVSVTNPELVTRAEKTLAPHGALHGYTTMKDLMDALNPLTGKIYLEALEWTRVGRIMCQLMFGKFPHPSTIVPGGMSTTVTTSTFNEYYMQLGKILDWCKVICRIWDDLCDFFLEANPAYEQVGARPTSLIQTGIYDNSEIYDATYSNCNQWGNARWASPSVIIEGKLVTTNLTDINIGMEEFVEHSFYDDWTKVGPQRYRADALGNPLSPYHAWNKTTLPKPTGTNFKDKYTWSTAPRWDRQVVETGAYGQLWGTALRGDYAENPFCNPTGDGLQLVLPRHALPETELFWPLPRTLNALERNRARAYSMAFVATIGMNCLLKAFEYWRKGETRVHTPFRIPRDERVSAGFWEASRGYLVHHMVMDKGKIVNYQINTPSTINASPTDPFGGLGPYEQSIVDTPILESVHDDQVKGIDILRSIRSFDPCMPCTTHMDTGRGIISREINSCGCTLE
ncbi:MAG: [Ni/Fe] hydrogenase, large subunit MSMEG_2719 [uncultured Acidimicrobiales bacterium]|uniref:[Ni/Fe] hydrogenase, large subunit MSMEG_2719 n=1 Tax=uncultured Acidimicrobiales bacterium TaxID=310071 RepID=A0A6J4JGB9_9ACTN|nr:MAG: [Ni/Fe] hydrogenase, large subunit MSMEG_2719 [uncultured Acidimicrobiales bacterium]